MAAAHRIQSAGKPKLAWVLTAIDDCAEKSDGLGLTSEALQHKLVGFMKAARAPRKDPDRPKSESGPSAYREFPPEPESGVKPTAGEMGAKAMAALELLGKVGTGGRR